ncbi:MAG: hypothetical protein WCQ99_13270 [Pseudomonadota bacterium]
MIDRRTPCSYTFPIAKELLNASVRMKGEDMAEANNKSRKATTVSIKANITCKDCGAFVEVTKKPSTVNCPKCGMSFKIAKSFKG